MERGSKKEKVENQTQNVWLPTKVLMPIKSTTTSSHTGARNPVQFQGRSTLKIDGFLNQTQKVLSSGTQTGFEPV